MKTTTKQTFGVIIVPAIFLTLVSSRSTCKVLDKLDKMGFGTIILPSEETPTGNIEGYAAML
jgi:hypothetical protein